MSILLDWCLPRRLKDRLASHGCRRVPEAVWAAAKSAELRPLAENAGFQVFLTQVFLTIDRGMETHQNLAARRIPVVFISSQSHRLAGFEPQGSAIPGVLVSLEPGQLVQTGRGTNS